MRNIVLLRYREVIRCPHETITVLQLDVTVLLPVDCFLRTVRNGGETHGLAHNITEFIDGRWSTTVISVQVGQHVNLCKVVVVVAKRVKDVLTNRYYSFIIAEKINQHFLVLRFKLIDSDRIDIWDLNLIGTNF